MKNFFGNTTDVKIGLTGRFQPEQNLSAILYRMIWRWHFYAGLFCIPFIVILSLSGSIYVFRPQIDAWEEAPFNQLTLREAAKPIDEQIDAALAAVPDSKLVGVEVRADPTDATRIIVISPDASNIRVMVRPDNTEILQIKPVQHQFAALVRNFHGELWLGTPGRWLVELAACWALIMIVTGLYLWWPRGHYRAAGIFYPRLHLGLRASLRDLHAVTGFWLSFLALFMLISGLTWTKVWGDGFRELRRLSRVSNQAPDWTNGRAAELEKHHHELADAASSPAPRSDLSFDQALMMARELAMAGPVTLLPPSDKRATWLVRAEPQNRPLARVVELDPKSGMIVKDAPFSAKPFMDRVVAIGVAAHEGQLFGWPNVALALLAALGFMTMVVSGMLMWLRRKPPSLLGAPIAISPVRFSPVAMIGAIVGLSLLLPLLGASLILIILIERLLLRRWPQAQKWLGLNPA